MVVAAVLELTEEWVYDAQMCFPANDIALGLYQTVRAVIQSPLRTADVGKSVCTGRRCPMLYVQDT